MSIEEEEAQRFLDSLEITQNQKSTPTFPHTEETEEQTEYIMIQENQKIIENANAILLERLENMDGSLQVKDLVSLKMEAFKQNQILKGKDNDTSVDLTKLIPTQINIQIINN